MEKNASRIRQTKQSCEMRSGTRVRQSSRVNSASPNVISAQGTTPSEDSNEVAMRLRKGQLKERRSIGENSNS